MWWKNQSRPHYQFNIIQDTEKIESDKHPGLELITLTSDCSFATSQFKGSFLLTDDSIMADNVVDNFMMYKVISIFFVYKDIFLRDNSYS